MRTARWQIIRWVMVSAVALTTAGGCEAWDPWAPDPMAQHDVLLAPYGSVSIYQLAWRLDMEVVSADVDLDHYLVHLTNDAARIAFLADLAALEGAIVTVTDDFGDDRPNTVIKHVDPARVRAVIHATYAYRAEVLIEAVDTSTS